MWALELGLALVLLIASLALAVSLWRLRTSIDAVTAASSRLEVIAAENTRLAKSARDVTRAVESTTAAVEIGTNIVRASHKAIAAIPFGVLESIPATRATSKFVRGIHDGTSAGVYNAISGVNKAIGNAVRDAMAARTGTPESRATPIADPVRIEVQRLDSVPELESAPHADTADPDAVQELVVEPEIVVAAEFEPAAEVDPAPEVVTATGPEPVIVVAAAEPDPDVEDRSADPAPELDEHGRVETRESAAEEDTRE